jgi:hypothetical protein
MLAADGSVSPSAAGSSCHHSSSIGGSAGSRSPQPPQRHGVPKCGSCVSVVSTEALSFWTAGSGDGNGSSEVDPSTPRQYAENDFESGEEDGSVDDWELEFILRSALAEIWRHLREGATQNASMLIDEACKEIAQYRCCRRVT